MKYDGTIDSGWNPLPIYAGWANIGGAFQVARYRFRNGILYMSGLLQNISGSVSGAAIVNIPAAYRVGANGTEVLNSFTGAILIGINGDVSPNTPIAISGLISLLGSYPV